MLEMMLSKLIKPTIIPAGQQEYLTAGTYTWTCPPDVVSICVAILGAGQSGSALSSDYWQGGLSGGVRWSNNIAVIPGNKYTIVVGSGGAWRYLFYNDPAPAVGGESSSAFGITAGLERSGTALSNTVLGHYGTSQAGYSSRLNTMVIGGDSASFTSSAPATYNQAFPSGLNLATGTMVRDGPGSGGNIKTPTVANPQYRMEVFAGRPGAVRIIWGKDRAFPNRNIGDK